MRKTKLQHVLAWTMTAAMVLSAAVSVPGLSLEVEAASNQYVKSLSVKKSVSVTVGSKVTVTPIVKGSAKVSKKVTVKSGNKKIAQASYSSKTKKITIQGKKAGSTSVKVVTAEKTKKGKKLQKSIKVTVKKKKSTAPTTQAPTTQAPTTQVPTTPTVQTVLVSQITLSKQGISLLKGEKAEITATVMPANAANRAVTWTAAPDGIVRLDADGATLNIQAVGAGTATVTAKAKDGSGKTAVCTVQVKDSVTVQSQEELNRVLALNVGEVIIDAAAGENYTADGNHQNVKLVVNGTGASIVNNGCFESVTLNGGTYTEKSGGNSIHVVASSDVIISENASAAVAVRIPDGTKANSSVKITNNGTLDELDIVSGADVTVAGEAKAVIPVNISGENARLATNQNVDLTLTAKAELVLRTAGQDDENGTSVTTIKADTPANTPEISGVGQYMVEYKDGSPAAYVEAEINGDIAPIEELSGRVIDALAENTTPIAGVSVFLIPSKEYETVTIVDNKVTSAAADNSAIQKQETDADGKYLFGETPSGNYYLVMLKEGYKKAVQFLAVSSDYQTRWAVEDMELLSEERTTGVKGMITGRVIDAATKQGAAEGLTVELRRNKGVAVGDTIATAVTEGDGSYTLKTEEGLEADQYTVRVVDNRADAEFRYISKLANVCVKSSDPTEKNLITSTTIIGDGIRFVLSWGNAESGAPRDLDAHLYVPDIDGNGYFEVYYADSQYEVNNELYAQLDVDETKYNGPETITINKPMEGIYYYYVHNYSHSEGDEDYEDGEVPAFASSGAKVDVYAGDKLLTTYAVPSDKESKEDWWKVCGYNAKTGQIIPYNVLEFQAPFQSVNHTQNDIQIDGFREYGIHSYLCVRSYSADSDPYKMVIRVPEEPENKKEFLSQLPFVCDDSNYKCEYDADENVLKVSNTDGDAVFYAIDVLGGYYITDVKLPTLKEWNEDESNIYLFYVADQKPEEIPQLTCMNGYTAVYAAGEDGKDIVEIRDADGTVVAKKNIYIDLLPMYN